MGASRRRADVVGREQRVRGRLVLLFENELLFATMNLPRARLEMRADGTIGTISGLTSI